jgi:hypothetical protein
MSDTIIVNVKGVRKSSWNEATKAASLRKDQYGLYLSDALDLRLRFDAGEITLPGEDGNQDAHEHLSQEQRTARIAALAELAKGIAAVREHTGKATGITMLSSELSALTVKASAKLRVIKGKDMGMFGQSRRIVHDNGLSKIENHEQDQGSVIPQTRRAQS